MSTATDSDTDTDIDPTTALHAAELAVDAEEWETAEDAIHEALARIRKRRAEQ